MNASPSHLTRDAAPAVERAVAMAESVGAIGVEETIACALSAVLEYRARALRLVLDTRAGRLTAAEHAARSTELEEWRTLARAFAGDLLLLDPERVHLAELADDGLDLDLLDAFGLVSVLEAPAQERLRAVAEALARGEALAADLAAWLGSALSAYLDHAADGATLDAVMGVATPRGGVPWWAAAARAERDELMRRFAAEHLVDVPPAKRPRALSVALRRYVKAAWRVHESGKARPEPGSRAELLFRIAQAARSARAARARIDVDERQAARILGHDFDEDVSDERP